VPNNLEDAPHRQEKRFRRFFELGLIGMAITSPTKGVLEVNDRLCEILGYGRDELGLKTWAEMTHPDDVAADVTQFDRVMAGEIDGYTIEKRWIRKDGQVIDSTISVRCVRRDDRSVEYFLALLQDITERAHAAEALRLAKEAAEASNLSKSAFLGVMSHELRTPLNAILGYAQLMDMGLEGPVTPSQRRALARIMRAQEHLLTLIDDILQFAKLDAGRVRLEPEDVSLAECCARVDALLAPQMAAKHLRYACAVRDDDGPVVARADRHRLLQIIVNLVTNAVKYTDDGGAITVEVAPDVDRVAVRVSDTGCGIPAARLNDVFEPFVQVEYGDRSRDGVGLGLAICRSLARAMGGDVTLTSTVGAGSTFTLTLPRVPHPS
jgi:PAS domain S-box-containing protein